MDNLYCYGTEDRLDVRATYQYEWNTLMWILSFLLVVGVQI